MSLPRTYSGEHARRETDLLFMLTLQEAIPMIGLFQLEKVIQILTLILVEVFTTSIQVGIAHWPVLL